MFTRINLLLILLLLVRCSSPKPIIPLPIPSLPSTSGQAINWYQPKLGVKWNIQFATQVNPNTIEPNLELIDLDLFDTSKETIQALKQKGINSICYFSAGSSEDWRSDFTSFPKEVLGSDMDGWKGEKWLDISNPKLIPIMMARMDLAKAKGCAGVELDNVDGYTNKTGFTLSYDQQLYYAKLMAFEAHQRGLAIGLKNNLLQVKDLAIDYDFHISEQCFQYFIQAGEPECMYLLPFIELGKPVLGIEYKSNMAFCPQAKVWKMDTVRKNLNLDATIWRCP